MRGAYPKPKVQQSGTGKRVEDTPPDAPQTITLRQTQITRLSTAIHPIRAEPPECWIARRDPTLGPLS